MSCPGPRHFHKKMAELWLPDSLSSTPGSYVLTACGFVVDYQICVKDWDDVCCDGCLAHPKAPKVEPSPAPAPPQDFRIANCQCGGSWDTTTGMHPCPACVLKERRRAENQIGHLRDALMKIRDAVNGDPRIRTDAPFPVGSVKRFREWAIEALEKAK